MTWLPTLLSWPAAAIAAAVAIPSLLLLYFLKLRRREQPVSSTLLWRKAIQDMQVNSPFQRLRRNLLLLLQLLVLIALLLALANPVTFSRAGAGQNSVILIDHSGSMNATDLGGRSRLEEAKRQAKNLVDSMGRNAKAMVIAFADSAETVQPYTADTAALKQAIDGIRPTDRPTSLKLAYQLADAQAAVAGAAGGTAQTVFLFSDGRATDADDASLQSTLAFEPIGKADAGNIAIVAFSAKRNFEQPTQVQVFARLANFGAEPTQTDLQLSVSPIDPASGAKDAFAVRQVKSDVKLLPARWNDQQREAARKQGLQGAEGVEFNLDLTTAAVIKLEQTHVAGDALAADDAAYVVVPPPKPLAVALVTDGNYFLEKAIHSLNLHDPHTFTPGEWEQQRPGNLDVVLFDRYAPKYLPASGNYIWFDAIPAGLALKQATDPSGKALYLSNVETLDWKRDHPLLRDLSLAKLYVAEAMKLDVPLADETLIEGTAGPLVVLDHAARATHLVVGFDVLQSNWPLRVSFPLFLHNALQYLAVGSDLSVREAYVPGATPRLPRAAVDRAAPGAKSLTLLTPQGSRTVEIPSAGDFALPPLDSVGLYATEPAVPGYERIAVNLLSDTESNLLPLDHAPGKAAQTMVVKTGRTPLQWWWWLLACIGLPTLFVEWWVYVRRVHA
ncbi:MAG: vWA domain-containing protein [Tepidisphaeraceae bacterium]